MQDITRLKHAEDRLERTIRDLRYQTQLMQTVFDNMEEGVLIADTQGNFLLANRRREEIIGKKLIAAEPAEWPATFGAFHLDRGNALSHRRTSDRARHAGRGDRGCRTVHPQ